jgi:hypothetical protein
MANRLDFFRQQMAAFEGSTNPLKAIDSGYYVPEPRKSVSDLIAGRLALRPASTHLILGGIGSGKTTQLLVTRDRINDLLDNAYVHYLDVSTYTDISNISPGALIVMVGLSLAKLLKNSIDPSVRQSIENIEKFAFGYSENKKEDTHIEETDVGFGLVGIKHKKLVHYQGILSSESRKKSDQLGKAVTELYSSLKQSYEQVFFLFDGLDRLDDTQSFSQLIVNDIQEISAIGIGCVMVGSARALYEKYQEILEQAIDYVGYQSCFDVENDKAAYDFFRSILRSRMAPEFMTSDLTKRMITGSGGILRDLINIAQLSMEEAYFSGDDCELLPGNIEQAIESFGRAKILGLTKSNLDILQDFAVGKRVFPASQDEIKLLISGKIVEYMYPKRRCTVHPALLSMLVPVEV